MSAIASHLRAIQITLLALLFVLLVLTDRFPGVPWLRRLRLVKAEPLTDEQRRLIRRRADRQAGVELILAGAITPLGALALWAMFFREPSVVEGVLLLLVIPGALIALGVWAIRKTR